MYVNNHRPHMRIPGTHGTDVFPGEVSPQRLAARLPSRDTFGIHGDILAGPRNLRPGTKTDGFSHGRIGIRVVSKMDGENNGNPPIKRDDLGGFNPLF